MKRIHFNKMILQTAIGIDISINQIVLFSLSSREQKVSND